MHQGRKFSSLDSSISSDKSDDDDDEDEDDDDDDDIELDMGDGFDDSMSYDLTKFMEGPKIRDNQSSAITMSLLKPPESGTLRNNRVRQSDFIKVIEVQGKGKGGSERIEDDN